MGICPLLATIAVGILAVHVEGHSVVAIPIVFLCGMMVGAGLSGCGIHFSYIHCLVALMAILLGIALAAGRRYPVMITAIAFVLIGIVLGHDDGLAIPPNNSPLVFLLGMLLSSLILLIIGLWLGMWMEAQSIPSRVFGVLVTAAGTGILIWSVVT
ncbi:hypothetical protein DTL42_08150 [Bremerella cremea]|uniref:Urease accessory protein UreJ n=2 Tax=Bremerella cremea TaxID=1031537 RepID=A0A368KSZ9_9BACT|nr:hypothetical protein DTL42_08150 [Bremerella cremea]